MLQKNAIPPLQKKITISFPGITLLKFKKNSLKKSNNLQPIPAATGPCPTIIGMLLQFYNNVQQNGNCVTLIRPMLISVCIVCPFDLSKNLWSLR